MYPRLTGLAVMAVLSLSACKKNDYTVYALTSNGHVIAFNAKKSTTLNSDVVVSGLATGVSLWQIFYRPSNKTLYCITSDNRLCTLDPDGGVATVINTGSSNFLPTDVASDTTLKDTVASIDPVNNQVRIFGTKSTTDDLNILVDPDTGVAATQSEESLVFDAGDVNDTSSTPTPPRLLSIAYNPPVTGVTSSTLYGMDANTNSLVRIGDDGAGSATNTTSPSNGKVHTIAMLDVGFSQAGLAIEAKNGDSYAALGTSTSSLYSIDLGSGTLSLLNAIGDGSWTVISIAIKPDN